MSEFTDSITREALEGIPQGLTDFGLMVEKRAKQLAPRGATNTLRNSIISSKAVKRGSQFRIFVSASALSTSGFDYAELQHDARLRHVSLQPFFQSFADFGFSGSPQKRYGQGYRALVGLQGRGGAPRFATKFLDRALEELEPMLSGLISG